MRYKLALASLLLLFTAASGCELQSRRYPRGMKVVEARIVEEDEAVEADEIIKRIEDQQQALEAAQEEPAEAMPATESPEVQGPPQDQPGPQLQPTRDEEQELTVDYLVSLLEEKPKRSDAEAEAYRRLLGLAPVSAHTPTDRGLLSIIAEAEKSVCNSGIKFP